MKSIRTIGTAAIVMMMLTFALLPAQTGSGGGTSEGADTLHVNWRPNGTYLLKTDHPRSIQAYYRDVGMTPLVLADRAEFEDMRETCLALGEAWRPLGHILLPDSRGGESFPLELCYFTAPNPEDMAQMKCANLGLALLENRGLRREIVCGREQGFS